MGCGSSLRNKNQDEAEIEENLHARFPSTILEESRNTKIEQLGLESANVNLSKIKNEDVKSTHIGNETSSNTNNSLHSSAAIHIIKKSLKQKAVLITADYDNVVKEIELTDEKIINSYVNPKNKLKLVLESIRRIIKENNVNENELSILITDTLSAHKEKYSKFEVTDQIKFSLLKMNSEINWNRRPYSKIMFEIDEYFNQNNLEQFYGFDWSNNLLTYEKNYLEFDLMKSNEDGSFQKFNLDVTEKYDKPKLLFFINHNDKIIIQKIKEIQNKKYFKNFSFIPIFGERTSGKKDAILKKEFMLSMGISEVDLYFLILSKNGEYKTKLEKFINFTSNDNNNNLISVCMILDCEGHVRFCGSPEDLCEDSINFMYGKKKINYSKIDAKKIKEELKLYFENKKVKGSLFQGSIKYVKAKIYSSVPLTGKVKAFVEPILVKCSGNNREDEIIDELKSSLLMKNYLSINDDSFLNLTLDHKAGLLIHEMNKIKEMNDLVNIKYSMILQIKKNFNSITYKEEFNLKTEKIKSTGLILNLECEMYESYNNIMEQMNILRTFPLIDSINYISVHPIINSSFPETLVLYNISTLNQEEINLSDDKPKFIIVVGYNKNEEEREDLKIRLERIWNEISSDEELLNNITLIIIFKGESIEEANELLNEEIFKSNENSIYLLNPNFLFNFPMTFDNFSFENSSSQLNCILLDLDNTVRYLGNTDELNLPETLNNLIQGKTIIEYVSPMPITQDFMKSEIKNEFTKFLNLVQKLFNEKSKCFYRPIVQLSFNKICEFENEEISNIFYQNLKLKIIYKQNQYFRDEVKIKKYFEKFQKKYLGSIKAYEIKICKLNLKTDKKCSICNLKYNKDKICEYFYDQEKEETICSNCELKMNPQFKDQNFIFCRYEEENQKITEEIIEEHFLTNINSGNYLDGVESPTCSLCFDDLTNHQMVWMSLIHLEDNSFKEADPIFICDIKCYDSIFNKKLFLQKEKRRMKILGIDENNFIFRKILLPSMSGFN